MPRGRHRHSSVLSRALPPAAAVVLTVAALAALVASGDTEVVRSVGFAAVLAVLGLALVLRQRDRAAQAAAEVAAIRRVRDEERFEEQLAEAEYAAEVAEERATRLGRRLTAEKSRLAKVETEMARLLRERAVMAAEQALKEAEATQRAIEAARPKHPVTAVAYLRAGSALRHLERRAQAARTQWEAEQRAERRRALMEREQAPALGTVDDQGGATHEQASAAPRIGRLEPAHQTARQVAQQPVRQAVAASPVRPVLTAPGERQAGAPATAIVPVERQRPRPQPAGQGRPANFSFFGRSSAAGAAALRAAAPAPSVGSVNELADQQPAEQQQSAERVVPVTAAQDLADVLGDEVAGAAAGGVPRPAVVDLTPEDETELLDLPELRAAH
ncbi:hypothetical protein P3T37_003284 [Kitasatospora sp. MAA4]|uniref:hypothetical protein n=1 Tax=Kitasatospora sp. MAA4 TaxID=3035093 RepID=UPI002475FC4F|nr:hypothetical protein [Kitasatospora sp. MAA4]MDH6133885.1 hypothetical protein [Kitasatospora sp. MAA4]